MSIYIVVTPLRNGGPESVPPGTPVEISDTEAAALVLLGALEPAPLDTILPPSGDGDPSAGAGDGGQLPEGDGSGEPSADAAAGGQLPPGESPAAPQSPAVNPNPLAGMKRPALAAEAARLGLSITKGMTNKQVAAAIEAKLEEVGR